MNKTLKTAVAAIALSFAALTLAGCSTVDERTDGEDHVKAKYIELPDGGEVLCVFWRPTLGDSTGSQMDCDWEGVAR